MGILAIEAIWFMMFPHHLPGIQVSEFSMNVSMMNTKVSSIVSGTVLSIPVMRQNYFCKTKIRMHFDYEEHEFCNIPDYNCYGHYLKHYNFMTKFQSSHLPLTQEVAAFGMNWLSQHIKNTDFTYRGKLHVRRFYDIPEPFTWDESFKVEIERLDLNIRYSLINLEMW